MAGGGVGVSPAPKPSALSHQLNLHLLPSRYARAGRSKAGNELKIASFALVSAGRWRCVLSSTARPAVTREGGRARRGGRAEGWEQGWDKEPIPVPGVIPEAGASAEPYPDVVLPVVSLLELLRCVGKSLQNNRERRSEKKRGKQGEPGIAHVNPGPWQHLPSLCSGDPPGPCRPSATQAGGQEEGSQAAVPGEGHPRHEKPVFLFAPAFPRASQCLQRNSCHLNTTRAEPLQLGGCWCYRWSRAGPHLQCRARAGPGSLHRLPPSSLQGRADPSKMLQKPP